MTQKYAPVRVEYINPFLSAAVSVFRTMLGCELTRGELYLKGHHQPDHEISGIIGMSGKAVGTVVLSLSRDVALSAAEAMLQERHNDIDAEVVDVVGELTNMIAGSAKAKLEQFSMSISLPNVVIGKNHTVAFPTGVTPIGIPFASKWGSVCVDVGLVEKMSPVQNSPAPVGVN
jgi:chemotaxis protein CheX